MLDDRSVNDSDPKGELYESAYLLLLKRIRRRIDYLTLGRTRGLDKIDKLTEDIADELIYSDPLLTNIKKGNSLNNIKSESVGEYRVEYEKKPDIDKLINIQDRLIDERIRDALAHTGLMFRGYYDNEHICNNNS